MVEKYQDGQFGDVKELREKLSELAKAPDEHLAKVETIHVGEEEKLKRLIKEKQKAILEYRVEVLEKKINAIMIHLGIDDKTEVLVVSNYEQDR